MTRHLVLVLGDQLDATSAAFDGFDPSRDAVWMAEVVEESTHVWSHTAGIAMFLAALRHFRATLTTAGRTVHQRELDGHATPTLAVALAEDLVRLRPARLIMVEPGDWRVLESLVTAARAAGTPLEIRPDRHFLGSLAEVVPGCLRRCGRVGRAAQHVRHVAACGRRHHGVEALRRHRPVHRPHEQLL